MLRIKLSVIKWSALILLTFILLLGFLFISAQTRYGKEGMFRIAGFLLKKKINMHLEVSGLKGIVPFDMGIGRLALYDESGPWLDIQDISFKFSPLYLFKGRIMITEFKADSVTISRLPQLKGSDKPNQAFSIPMIAYRIGIKQFDISRLSLGKEILGEPADFVISAGITGEELGVKSRVSVNINRTDGAPGSAFLEAEIEGADPYLVINAGIEEPEKGLIGLLTDINSPISMSFNGSGRIRDWNGELSFNSERMADIEARIGMRALEDLYLDIEGTGLLHRGIIPGSLAAFAQEETGFNIRARINEDNELFLEQADIRSDIALLSLTASMDIGDMSVEGSFNAEIKDISPLGPLLNKDCSGVLEINGDFRGPITLPDADIIVAVRGLETDIIRANELSANVHIESASRDDSSYPALRITGEGKIKDLYIPSLSNESLEKELGWALDVTWQRVNDDIEIDNLTLKGVLLTAGMSGLFDMEQRELDLEASIDIESIDRFSGILDRDIHKGIGTNVNLTANISGRSLESLVSGKLFLNSDADAHLMAVMGTETTYAADITLSEWRTLTFSRGKIGSDKAVLTFSGLYDLDKRMFRGMVDLETQDLEAFSGFINRDLMGSARIRASLEGTLDMIDIDSEFRADNIFLDNTGLEHLSGSIALSGQPLNNRGKISFSGTHNGFRLNCDSGFMLDNKVLAFEDLSLEGTGFNMHGNLSADMEGSVLMGELDGDFTDFSIINALSGREILGSATLHMKSVMLSGMNTIELNIHGKDITDPIGHTDNIDMDLSLSGPLDDPEITCSASIIGFSKDDILLKSVNIKAQGRPEAIGFSLTGAGNFVYGIVIQTSGDISLSSSAQSLAIKSFRGEYGILPVSLTSPFRVTRSDKGVEFERMEFNIAGGSVAGYGRFSGDAVDLNLNINNIPMSLLTLAGIDQLEGNARGSITLSGDPTQPYAEAFFSFNNMRLRDTQYAKMPSLNLSGSALLESGILDADLVLDSQSGTPFELTISLPAILSLSPFSFMLSEDEEISGRISGGINLENITKLTDIYDQKFKGDLSSDFYIKGTIRSPEISGSAQLQKGGYENYSMGSLIKDITIDISADSNRFILNSISGTDGEDGKVSGDGWFDFSPSRGFPYSLSLKFKNMIFLRSSTAFFTVSGKPTIAGELHDHTLTGKFTVESGEYRIPERLPAEITDLEVTEINGPGQEQATGQKEAMEKTVINLDMSVEGSRHIYLTGRGLNSEWKGDIEIKGNTIEPVIIGRLSVLRGSYNFLGKRFELTEGQIDLDGTYPAAPYLDVTGEAKTSKITAIIKLVGDLKKPEVTLTSDDPSLPSDEILSQLLFGRDVSQITPFQAIQLGNALNVMMGNTRYDIVGSTRKMLGVDQLELVQSEENEDESAVTVGKYLRDDLYIELEKGLGTESGKASFTWEVTPNITIDTELNENSSTGVGINWKWDY